MSERWSPVAPRRRAVSAAVRANAAQSAAGALAADCALDGADHRDRPPPAASRLSQHSQLGAGQASSCHPLMPQRARPLRRHSHAAPASLLQRLGRTAQGIDDLTGAVSGEPLLNGGAGLYSICSWICCATVSPRSIAARCKPNRCRRCSRRSPYCDRPRPARRPASHRKAEATAG